MRRAAVFKDEDPLPGPQGHLAIDNGNNFTCAGEGHAQVTGGIIGTFESVNIVAGLRRDSFEIAVEISPGARVSIFIDDEAGTGMANEDGNSADFNPTLAHSSGDLFGDLVGSFAASANGDLCVFDDHCGL